MLEGTIAVTARQNRIFGLSRGSISSMRITRSGHGKSVSFLITGPAVTQSVIPPFLMLDSIAARPAVKLRFTGMRSARITARFATRPAFPGGSTMLTRAAPVFVAIQRLSAMPAARSMPRESLL
jgi:hypothetical protein